MTPSSVLPMIASSEDSTIEASRAAASAAIRRSVTSRTAAATIGPSAVSILESEISAGNSVPSRRRAVSGAPCPIGRGRGSWR
jgi:hypothetical protein